MILWNTLSKLIMLAALINVRAFYDNGVNFLSCSVNFSRLVVVGCQGLSFTEIVST